MLNIPRHIPANPHRIRLHKHRSSTTWQLSHLLGTRYLHSALVRTSIYRVYDLRFTVGSHRTAKPKAKPKPLEFLKCPLKRAACLRARPQLSDSMIIRVCTCSLGFPIRGIDWHRNRSPLPLFLSVSDKALRWVLASTFGFVFCRSYHDYLILYYIIHNPLRHMCFPLFSTAILLNWFLANLVLGLVVLSL